MNLYKINNNLTKTILLIIIIILNASCTNFKDEIIVQDEEIIFEDIVNFEYAKPTSYHEIRDYWTNQNNTSFLFNYTFEKILKFNFGKGESGIKYMISNPILLNDSIFLIDNNSTLTRLNYETNSIVWQKKINENYKSNLISPISLISINNYIITTSGNGNINAFDFDGNLIWSKNFYMTIKTPSFILNDLVLILLIILGYKFSIYIV